MADIELDDLGQACDFFRAGKIETVPGMDFKAGARRQRRAARNARELSSGGGRIGRVKRLAPRLAATR